MYIMVKMQWFLHNLSILCLLCGSIFPYLLTCAGICRVEIWYPCLDWGSEMPRLPVPKTILNCLMAPRWVDTSNCMALEIFTVSCVRVYVCLTDCMPTVCLLYYLRLRVCVHFNVLISPPLPSTCCVVLYCAIHGCEIRIFPFFLSVFELRKLLWRITTVD